MSKITFDIICTDSPWNFDDNLSMSDVKRSAQANYQTMSLDDIKALPVAQLADPTGCLLSLWVPGSMIVDGIDVMKAYGFEVKQNYIWVKTKKEPFKNFSKNLIRANKNLKSLADQVFKNMVKQETSKLDLNDMLGFGMGHLFRQSHEICLIGINNTGIYKKLANKSQRSISLAYNEEHSKKPEHLQDSLELMFPKTGDEETDPQYLELFARRERKGWLCLGNEINGQDIRDEMRKLVNAQKSIVA